MDLKQDVHKKLRIRLEEWETGDIVLIDNYLVMHGRRPYKGDRRVLASLASVDTKK